MNYNLELSDDVKKQLRKMDKHIAIMLSGAMQKELDGMENPRSKGKALVG